MKYVLLSGYPRNENSAKMEVVDMNGNSKLCKDRNAYPLEISLPVATYTEGKILVCGGEYPLKFTF